MIYCRKFLENVINDFNNKGYSFKHIAEINIITIANKRYMSYDFYIKHNMHAVEKKLNMIIAKNPQLMNSLDRSNNHPLLKNLLTYHLITNKCM